VRDSQDINQKNTCLLISVFPSRFDIDGRGQIDQKDLVKVIQEIGEGQSYDQIRATIKTVDINATGKVEVDEFLEVRSQACRKRIVDGVRKARRRTMK
jgi:plastin-1